jgi:hypothetical protein
LRDFGGTCAKGHLLTRESAYVVDGRVRCAVCQHDAACAARRRAGAKPRPRGPEPDPKVCRRCGEAKPLAEFGAYGHRKDGSTIWQSWCRDCRNGESADRRRRDGERRRAERQQVTRWIVAGVEALRAQGHRVKAIVAALGITQGQWATWRTGKAVPEEATIRRVSDRLLELRARTGDGPGRG